MVSLSGEKIDKNDPRAIQKALYKDMLKMLEEFMEDDE